MDRRIYDSELKLMELLWTQPAEGVSAKELSRMAEERIGWKKNTTYTVVTKLVEKGYVERREPGFLCRPLLSLQAVRQQETKSLVDRLFGGSKKALFSALLEDEMLSEGEAASLREMIEKR